ncbi:MAG: relaxase/mobilization nuclease domain-containing protein [Lachnospiraceae bacterium]|nr:relaxase/mobilization nuclease domain-containing protein [Lachnospiraceae bacterium]
MIVKIWPIKGRNNAKSATSGKQSLQDSVDYISDKEKVIKSKPEIYDDEATRAIFEEELQKNSELTWEEFCQSKTDDINRSVNYASNEQKTQGYVSGFLCDPEFVIEQFYQTKRINLERVGKTLEDDKGNIAYHIVQSFPPELDISDEEVHQCGLELLKKMGNYNEELGTYQGVVASHVHPAIDEVGEVHGECKHNHIIINSHRHHEFIDPERPDKMKYHDCNETYALLQLINDQIALEHGLPVISEPDKDKTYSWYETAEKNQGKSWKERVRVDIENAMRVSNNRDEYIRAMQASGYKIRIGDSKDHGEYVSYTCPDGTHKVRDYTLGQAHTLPYLESYWKLKQEIENTTKDIGNGAGKESENIINQIMQNSRNQLFVKIERKTSNKRKDKLKEAHQAPKDKYTISVPLPYEWDKKVQSYKSYFIPEKEYNIYDENRRYINTVTGQDILLYLRELEEKERQAREKEEEKQKYYSRSDFINTRTRKPYRVRIRDEEGRVRTNLELMFILAVVVIQNESDFAETKKPARKYYEDKGNPIYGQRDWKIQNMLDTIRVAREENLTTQEEVNAAVNAAGKNCAKARAAIKRIEKSINNMSEINEAIRTYQKVKDVCEQLHAEQKPEELFTTQEKEALEKYKKAKAVLYRATIKTDEDIADFLNRRQHLEDTKKQEEANLEKAKGEYRRLSKVRYNMQLAQNKQYCYGARYEEPAPEQEIRETSEDKTIQEVIDKEI